MRDSMMPLRIRARLRVHENAPVLDPHRVDGGAETRLVDADAGLEIELPPVPGAPERAPPGQLIPSGPALDPLADAPEAERPSVMRAAVPDPVRGAVRLRDDPDLATVHTGDEAPGALEVGRSADVDPLSQRREGPAAPRRARRRSRAGPSRAMPPAAA